MQSGRLAKYAGAALFALALASPALSQTPPPHPAGMWNLLERLDRITATQRAQIEAVRVQYEQTHEPGTIPDRATMQRLRQQVMQILTAAQQAQLRAELQRFRQAREQTPPDASPSPS